MGVENQARWTDGRGFRRGKARDGDGKVARA